MAKENHMMATNQFFHNTFWFLSTLLASVGTSFAYSHFSFHKFMHHFKCSKRHFENTFCNYFYLLFSFPFIPPFLSSFIYFGSSIHPTWRTYSKHKMSCPPSWQSLWSDRGEKNLYTITLHPVHAPSRLSCPFFITVFLLSSLDQGCKTALEIN